MTNETSLGVRVTHPDYDHHIDRWRIIRDVLAADCKRHLRDVGSTEPDKSYATKRQKDYEKGAIFYNFTKRTLSGMVGSVMRKPAEIELADKLEYLLDNCDGAGLSIEQQAQYLLKECDSIGRAGLLVDAPSTAAATMAEQNEGILNPRILLYSAENIINWHTRSKGSAKIIDMVVLRETYEYPSENNEFCWLRGERFRVLEIVDGVYRQRVFTYNAYGELFDDEQIIEPKVNNKSLNYIPFVFVGADNNDERIDTPPLDTLSDVNIGHYRNSADVEESGFICSQPTLMIYPGQNMSPQQFQEANKDGIRIGSRTGHNLGYGGNAELLQAQESNLSLKLMEQKEEQAVKIGAQLITPTQQITAESARLQRGADTSIMATIAVNVSDAYTKAINWCGEFFGDNSNDNELKLNMEFFLLPMTAQDRAAWMSDINAGLLPARAYYAALRQAGATDWTDEKIEDGLDAQTPAPAPQLNTSVTGDIPVSENNE